MTLRLARRVDRCTVLGPGVRAVLWVQGCPLRCPGCVAPEALPFEGGTAVPVDDLADDLAALPGVDGVTLSGGEPTAQAAALCRLIDRVRSRRDLSFLCYSGFTLDALARGPRAVRELLRRIDILVDGPYLRDRHTDLRWRGSDNQRVHFLTPRHADAAGSVGDRGRWLEVAVTPAGVGWMGIPPPGFPAAFERALAEAGVVRGSGGSGRERDTEMGAVRPS